MTIDDFRKAFEQDRSIIECKNIEERKEMLCFLLDLGYLLNSSCMEYLNKEYPRSEFMHPGMSNISRDTVACFRDLSIVTRPILRYADVEPLFDALSQSDAPDEAEFNDGISSLLFG